MLRQLLLLLAMLAASHCFAAPPTDESLEALFKITRAQRMVDDMLGSLEGGIRESVAAATNGKSLSAEQQRLMDAIPAKMVALVRQEMSWERLHPIYVEIYRSSFTQEEVDGMLAFYRSPAGAAVVDKLPVVMQKTLGAVQSLVPGMTQRLGVAMQKALDEAKAAK